LGKRSGKWFSFLQHRLYALINLRELIMEDQHADEKPVIPQRESTVTKKQKYAKADVYRETLDGEKRIRPYIRQTYLEPSYFLSEMGKSRVSLKMENSQITGSFKLRGAMNSMLALPEKERLKGITTASTGNHGAAVSYVMKKFGIRGKIFVPENISKSKLEVLKGYKADLVFHGTDNAVTEAFARKIAEKEGIPYISPYNDAKVIGGQGTVGIELMGQAEKPDVVFVPVGGGGLISGIAGYLKTVSPDTKIIGCQPENSHVMYDSVKAGEIVEVECPESISDGTAGGVEEGSLTFDICRDEVDGFVLVTEEEIAEALRLVLRKEHMMIEGAAALSVAAYLKTMRGYKGKSVALVLSGNKLDFDVLRRIISGEVTP